MSYAFVAGTSHKSGFNSYSSYAPEPRDSHPQVPYVTPAPRRSKLNPKTWSRKAWISALIVAATVLGAVPGSRANRYPSYGRLNYSILDTYSLDYLTWYDPSDGFVHYVDQQGSVEQNLTFASANSAVLRVDTTDEDASTGRGSVRITSEKQFNSGLLIFDILHAPCGCGTWPAIWSADLSSWPKNGEIDVLEVANSATTGNQTNLHTSNGYTMRTKGKESGTVLTSIYYNRTDSDAGCGVQGPDDISGEALNNNGGGVSD